jgi:hypothetical protein
MRAVLLVDTYSSICATTTEMRCVRHEVGYGYQLFSGLTSPGFLRGTGTPDRMNFKLYLADMIDPGPELKLGVVIYVRPLVRSIGGGQIMAG